MHSDNHASQWQKNVVKEGKIHKCPYCLKELNSFTTICPDCKREIRGGTIADSLNEFCEKLYNIDSEDEKIKFIKTYPIPNSKEDIFEFMFLSASNFDSTMHATHIYEEDVSDAWLTKIEQCYQKA